MLHKETRNSSGSLGRITEGKMQNDKSGDPGLGVGSPRAVGEG